MWKYITGKPQPSKSNYAFKMRHSFNQRKIDSSNIREKHPTKVPVIIEKSTHSDLPDIQKTQYLLDESITIGQFIYVLRSTMKLTPSQAIFIFVDNSTVPSILDKLGDIYSKHADKDGFLYMTYAAENTFG